MQHSWLLFLLVSAAAVFTPGPAMLTLLGHSLAHGARATVPVVFGNLCGVLLLLTASVAGLAALLEAVPQGLLALKWAGICYLVWLGLRAMQGGEASAASTAVGSGSVLRRRWLRGLLVALSNPKALTFYAAVLPQFVDPRHSLLRQLVELAGTFVVLELSMTLGVTFGASVLAPRLGPSFVQHSSKLGGAIMLGAAVVLALTPLSA